MEAPLRSVMSYLYSGIERPAFTEARLLGCKFSAAGRIAAGSAPDSIAGQAHNGRPAIKIMRVKNLADSKPEGFNHVHGSQPHGAGHASRFAAAALPPHRGEPEQTRAADVMAEVEAARIAAAHYDALYGTAPAKPALSRTLVMLLIFAIGACAGLASAWWLASGRTAPVHPHAAPLAVMHRDAGVVPATDVRGIRASELPYDGIAPAGQDRGLTLAQPVRYGGTLDTMDVMPVVPADTRDGKAQPKVTREAEAERPRQQAHKESNKKTRPAASETKRAAVRKDVEQVALSGRGTSGGSMKARYASCEKQSNIFKREQCRWRVCGDSWGKNGCPSYAVKREPY